MKIDEQNIGKYYEQCIVVHCGITEKIISGHGKSWLIFHSIDTELLLTKNGTRENSFVGKILSAAILYKTYWNDILEKPLSITLRKLNSSKFCSQDIPFRKYSDSCSLSPPLPIGPTCFQKYKVLFLCTINHFESFIVQRHAFPLSSFSAKSIVRMFPLKNTEIFVTPCSYIHESFRTVFGTPILSLFVGKSDRASFSA